MLLAQVDDLVPGTALALRLVHRGVGVLEELLGELVAPTRERDADAGRHLDFGRREDERAPRPPRRSGPRSRRPPPRSFEVLAQDDELVARQARQGVARTQQRGQALGDGDQQLVADAVAVEVVDQLEPVEIDEQDRGHLARPAAPKHRVVEPLEQEDPVRQPGQRVVERALAGTARRSPGGLPAPAR